MTSNAIQTRYAGCKFRSRLEARWAVFFNDLGVRWQYEPEGFSLPAGPYLPDFWLPQIGKWFEVKPDLYTEDNKAIREDPRWAQLVEATGKSLVVAFGMPRPNEDLVWGSFCADGWMEEVQYNGPNVHYPEWPDTVDWPVTCWDNGRAFCICHTCGAVGIEFEGRAHRLTCHRELGQGDRGHNYDDPRILHAYNAACSARFEHGQSGA